MNKNGEQEYAYQNTWAITTRMLGVMLGIHGDDKGVIIPPRLAPLHVVIVPILFEDSMEKVLSKCRELKEELEKHKYHEYNINVHIDDRNYKPGWKFNEWELKGIPLRIELGPKDLEKHQAVIVRRDTFEKQFKKMTEIPEAVKSLLDNIQHDLFVKAKRMLDDSIVKTDDITEFKKFLDDKKIVLAPYCDTPECEDQIKADTGAKPLNKPLDQDSKELRDNKINCVSCKGPAKAYFYFGKSY